MNTDSTILSRANWTATQPKGVASKEISEQFLSQLGLESSFDPATDPVLGIVPGSLVYA